jgi:hypothetical protein
MDKLDEQAWVCSAQHDVGGQKGETMKGHAAERGALAAPYPPAPRPSQPRSYIGAARTRTWQPGGKLPALLTHWCLGWAKECEARQKVISTGRKRSAKQKVLSTGREGQKVATLSTPSNGKRFFIMKPGSRKPVPRSCLRCSSE